MLSLIICFASVGKMINHYIAVLCSAVVPVFSAIVSVCKYNLTDEKSEHILHSELISQTPSPIRDLI